MAFDRKKIIRFFTWKRLLFPIIIGLGVAVWLLIDDFDVDVFKGWRWGYQALLCVIIAAALQVLRDVFYMLRLRILTERQLSWRQSFQVVMLWEFASAITPSVVGGSAVAFFIIEREGIALGRSTAIVLITAFLDEMFYLLMVPIVLAIVGFGGLFDLERSTTVFGMEMGMKTLFYAGYGFILILNAFIAYGIFFNPKGLKNILVSVFKLRILKRWREQAERVGNDIVTTSVEMKKKSFSFWMKAASTTFFSWTARFLMVNFLIVGAWYLKGSDSFEAIPIIGDGTQWLIYAKQLVMWIVLMISPIPGGSGVAEYLFSDFLSSFIPVGLSPSLALLWRLMSYYSYLIAGLIVFPLWLRRVFSRKHLKKIEGRP
ncbi:MAG: flippase-like domain-containing protein [Bacteroidales bacterium]|nr:flippase-like domain-containing protein [Bacteroidales bacterium]